MRETPRSKARLTTSFEKNLNVAALLNLESQRRGSADAARSPTDGPVSSKLAAIQLFPVKVELPVRSCAFKQIQVATEKSYSLRILPPLRIELRFLRSRLPGGNDSNAIALFAVAMTDDEYPQRAAQAHENETVLIFRVVRVIGQGSGAAACMASRLHFACCHAEYVLCPLVEAATALRSRFQRCRVDYWGNT